METNDYKYSQVFLKNSKLIADLIEETNIKGDDIVVEIGAGEGIITRELIKVVSKGELYALEPDPSLFRSLTRRIPTLGNLHLLNQSVAEFEWPKSAFQIFSNIPFNATSEILNILLNPNLPMDEANIIVQKEVAQMYTEENSLKSLLAFPFFDIYITHTFQKSDFEPKPRVHTVMMRVQKKVITLLPFNRFESYRDFLYFISQDRVGEGHWNKLLKRADLGNLGMTCGHGIKQQKAKSILNTYVFLQKNNKLQLTKGSYTKSISRPLEKHFRTRLDRKWTEK